MPLTVLVAERLRTDFFSLHTRNRGRLNPSCSSSEVDVKEKHSHPVVTKGVRKKGDGMRSDVRFVTWQIAPQS